MNIPVDSVGAAQMNPADLPTVDQIHHLLPGVFADTFATTTAAVRKLIYCAKNAGVVKGFKVGVTVAAVGDSTITLDLFKNGTTVLSAAKTVNAGHGTTAQDASLSGTPATLIYAAGDRFEASVTISAGTGTLPKGAYGVAFFDEVFI
jgi:hypothetical protein